MTMKSVI